MTSSSDRSSRNTDTDDDTVTGNAFGVMQEGDSWQITRLTDAALTSLDDAARQVRSLRTEGASFGLVDVDHEFFVILRPGPSGMRLMLSDATASLDYDLAADVLEELNVDVPDMSDEELEDTDPWGEGDMSILEDLGLPPGVLEIIVSETDLYADEQLQSVAERMGFGEVLERHLPDS
ncbi:tRNA adenosine deaminase-associated protein [Rhodococcus sp. IEGM 1408]|uniref:tRNA adenosine deaminase-associated protein n=1 Tax=Rhodococcus sp. IEGM 1408 TaxID=3082220 RepID=UPI002955B260|nr:tRNA adenosine deaminase-associated protein [Rhodococcus sp. IEGM 1408]MDV8002146.1 tRNA adenosine deaminase-associated protein [Rhodococcus sp. IEGM 1408]